MTSLTSHGLFSERRQRELSGATLALLIRTPVLSGEGFTLMALFKLDHLLTDPAPNTVTLRDKNPTYECMGVGWDMHNLFHNT